MNCCGRQRVRAAEPEFDDSLGAHPNILPLPIRRERAGERARPKIALVAQTKTLSAVFSHKYMEEGGRRLHTRAESHMKHVSFPSLVCVAAFCFIALASGAAAAESPGFTDVSRDSGVNAVIDAHYAEQPKWWLSGTNLIDHNGDGHLDLFLGAHGQTATVALNDGKGHFQRVDPKSEAKLPPTEIHVAADLDGDGLVDLQMTHQDGGGRWYHNASKPNAVRFEPTEFIADQGRENAMIDVDRDGKLDWIHEDARAGAIVFEIGDGLGAFRRAGGFTTLKESSALPADLNGDRQIDFVIKQCGYHDEHAGHSRVMLNDGHGQFIDRTSECGISPDGVVIQGIGDVNQDGSLDFICIEHGKNIAIYLNEGKAHFKKLEDAITGMETVARPAYANWGLAVVTDFDNDGTADVLMNGRNFLYLLRGTGGGHFACMNKPWRVPDFSWSAVDEGLCFGDVDHDGRLDLVVSSGSEKQKRMSLLHNDLPARHWLNVRPIGAAGNRPAAGAVIQLLEPGTGKLLWHEQVIIGGRQTATTYCAYGTTERHFGLGDRATVDIRVEIYPSDKVVTREGVKADQTVEVIE
jgi:hypothetical protein